MDRLSVAGSFASIIGLLVTLYVAYSVKQIRQRYVRRIVLRDARERLRKAQDGFSTSVANDDKSGVRNSAGQIRVLLIEIRLLLRGERSIEFPLKQLDELIGCSDGRKILSIARDLLPLLIGAAETIDIAMNTEELGRDDG